MKQIAVIAGDGIGPEIMREAIKVLEKVFDKYGIPYTFIEALAGGAAIDEMGTPLPAETLNIAKSVDAVLLGAVGGPKWDQNAPELRPEKALLGLRKELELYANLRPVTLFAGMETSPPLKPEVIAGTDLLVVRELTGGIYFGEKKREKNAQGEFASDLLIYHEYEIERIVRQAFQIAQRRRKHLTSVDKANVLESSRLWRAVVDRIALEYADVTVEHMLIDNCAMQLIRNPQAFDVLVTENMFGDILSDEAAMLTGSIGLLPSASLGTGAKGMYEPVHGSAPDIARKGIANPVAMILSAAMLVRHSIGYEQAATDIESAVKNALKEKRTADLIEVSQQAVSTSQFGDLVAEQI